MIRAAVWAVVSVTIGVSFPSRAAGQVRADTTRFRAPVRICTGGDVTLGTNLDRVWSRRAADSLRQVFGRNSDPYSLVEPLRPFMAGADITLINVEGAIGAGAAPSKCGPRSTSCFAFRSDPDAATALRSLVDSSRLVVGNVANNHARDAGREGLDSTLVHLTNAGVVFTGADTIATPVITARGDTIAFLGFHTSNEAPDARDLVAVRRHVSRAVADYGTVIVTMHLGAEGPTAQRTRDVSETFVGERRGNPVQFANAVFGAGATMVIGHGPHVLRAVEWRGTRLVAYSLGNLLTYGPFKLREPTNRGAVLCATIVGRGRVEDAELRATMQLAPGVLTADSSKRALRLVDSLSARDFPRTGASVSPTGALRPPKR